MIYCSNCSKPLSDVAGICPYCGTAVSNAPFRPVRREAPDDTLSILNARIERSRRRRDALPQDERMLHIISDFEFRTDVVYKPVRTPRVYQAQYTYNPGSLYTPPRVSPAVIILNILMTLVLPPLGFIRALFILTTKKDKRMKDLGLAMLIISIVLLIAEVFIGVILLRQ